MVRMCVIKTCKQSKEKHGVSLHKVKPSWFRNVTILNKSCGSKIGEAWQPSKHSVICSDHFVESDFDNTYLSKKKLGITVVPTLKSEAVPRLCENESKIPEVDIDNDESSCECAVKSMRRDEKSNKKQYSSEDLTKMGCSGTKCFNPETTSHVTCCNQYTTNTCNILNVVEREETSFSTYDNVKTKFKSAKTEVEAVENVEHEDDVTDVAKQKEELMTLLCLRKNTTLPDLKDIYKKTEYMNSKSNKSVDKQIKACPTKRLKDMETKHKPLKQSVTRVMDGHDLYEAVTPPPIPSDETRLLSEPSFHTYSILYTCLSAGSATTASECNKNATRSLVRDDNPIHNDFNQSNDDTNTVTTQYTRNAHSKHHANSVCLHSTHSVKRLCKDNRASAKADAKGYECISKNEHSKFRIDSSNRLTDEGRINCKSVKADRHIIKPPHSTPYILTSYNNTTSAYLDNANSTDRINSNFKRSIGQNLKRNYENALSSESSDILNRAYCIDNTNYGTHFSGQRAFINTPVDHMSKSYVIQNTLILEQRNNRTNEHSFGQYGDHSSFCRTETEIPRTSLSNRLGQFRHNEMYPSASMSKHKEEGCVFQVPSKREKLLLDNTCTLRTLGTNENQPFKARNQETRKFIPKLQRIPIPNLNTIETYAKLGELQTVYSQTQVSDSDVPLDLSVNKDKTADACLENVTWK